MGKIAYLGRPLPPTYFRSYSHPESQNTLVRQTKDFPDQYDTTTEQCYCNWSDHICRQRPEAVREISKLLYGDDQHGDQGWAHDVGNLSEEDFLKFAQIALNLPVLPKHVRVVYHFNVSNGFNCPTVEAIFAKENEG